MRIPRVGIEVSFFDPVITGSGTFIGFVRVSGGPLQGRLGIPMAAPKRASKTIPRVSNESCDFGFTGCGVARCGDRNFISVSMLRKRTRYLAQFLKLDPPFTEQIFCAPDLAAFKRF